VPELFAQPIHSAVKVVADAVKDSLPLKPMPMVLSVNQTDLLLVITLCVKETDDVLSIQQILQDVSAPPILSERPIAADLIAVTMMIVQLLVSSMLIVLMQQ
jgi:hypothetical protein